MRIYKKWIPLIVCTFNKDLLSKMSHIDEILLLDTSEIKSEIIAKMRLNLNVIKKYFAEELHNH
ncbi:hypothetical protein [Flavobacterium yafengii]|uniref:hypothetical protein n=1 Tax=Flavobacterium yafengii TaxID=3041253 RepID=UPI0024A84F0E|nr:hypothetical protein [Flavobacterium yafengii]MDI5899626.1 hypothetical protein [Flavobacterium yafengii]